VKKLKIWNGRGQSRGDKLEGHLYVCATSRADVVNLLKQVGYDRMNLHELDVYWSSGCWGNAMAGIAPERGVWITRKDDYAKPERLI
jgi:hypothetical protein